MKLRKLSVHLADDRIVRDDYRRYLLGCRQVTPHAKVVVGCLAVTCDDIDWIMRVRLEQSRKTRLPPVMRVDSGSACSRKERFTPGVLHMRVAIGMWRGNHRYAMSTLDKTLP